MAAAKKAAPKKAAVKKAAPKATGKGGKTPPGYKGGVTSMPTGIVRKDG